MVQCASADWTLFNQNCYKFYNYGNYPYKQGQDNCKSIKSKLVLPINDEEADFVSRYSSFLNTAVMLNLKKTQFKDFFGAYNGTTFKNTT